MVERCAWVQSDPLLIDYHDQEWGKEATEDQDLFEQLILELFQTGLSWRTVLQKREAFRVAFDQFNFTKVALYDDSKVDELVANKGIIRHRGKIMATIFNANVVLQLIQKHGTLYQFFNELPQDFKEKQKIMKRTFKHVGPSVLESFLIAAGFVKTPHDSTCFLVETVSKGQYENLKGSGAR